MYQPVRELLSEADVEALFVGVKRHRDGFQEKAHESPHSSAHRDPI
jgi:hypothetical protein